MRTARDIKGPRLSPFCFDSFKINSHAHFKNHDILHFEPPPLSLDSKPVTGSHIYIHTDMKAQLTVFALFAALAAAAPAPADDSTSFAINFNKTAAEDALKAVGLLEDDSKPKSDSDSKPESESDSEPEPENEGILSQLLGTK